MAGLATGSNIGPYQIRRLLGRGGMGEVYLAENRHTGWKRALKVLPQELSTKSDFILRFKREAAVLDQLEHPGIVRVREMGEDQGRFYLVMDYIEGPEGKPMTLADHATQWVGPLDPVKLGEILIEVCEALSYAHGKGVIHRDLKPSNILLNHEGRAIVSDFGLARVVGREFLQRRIEESISRSMSIGQGKTMFAPAPVDPSIGREGTGEALGSSSRSILGTWDYMSPEVRNGEEATEKSDIYAIGVILYRLLTGVHQIGFEMPSELVDGLDEEWDRIYRTAAATKPEKRYVSCSQVTEALKEGMRKTQAAQERAQRELEERKRREEALKEAEQRRRREEDERKQREEAKRQQLASEAEIRSRVEEKRPSEPRPQPAWSRRVLVALGVVALLLIVAPAMFRDRSRQMTRTGRPTVIDPTPIRRPTEPEPNLKVIELPSITNSVGMKMVLIPAGTFMMGSEKGFPDEEPVHEVRIEKPFYMDVYEVTQGQWKAVMGSNPSGFKGDDSLPVEQVSWDECQEFLRRLSVKEGVTYRLASEAEWEYACRAGSTTEYCFGGDESWLDEYAWFKDNSGGQTHPVGQKKPNAWGLYDMHGNVWEWCEVYVHDDYVDAPTNGDPWTLPTAKHRVFRGGGWGNVAGYCRSASRNGSGPSYRGYSIGFRLARTP